MPHSWKVVGMETKEGEKVLVRCSASEECGWRTCLHHGPHEVRPGCKVAGMVILCLVRGAHCVPVANEKEGGGTTMKTPLRIEVDVTHTHGPAYITATARMLAKLDHPEHPGSSDWRITAIAAMDVTGCMQVYWRLNADWSVLRDGDLPESVLVLIRESVRHLALSAEVESDELHDLADYCDELEGEG